MLRMVAISVPGAHEYPACRTCVGKSTSATRAGRPSRADCFRWWATHLTSSSAQEISGRTQVHEVVAEAHA